MKKVLYVYGGPAYHPTEQAGEILKEMLVSDGRFGLEMTDNLDIFAELPNKDYAGLVVYTTGFYDGLTPEREKGLLDFVRNGGGFVGIHSATDSFRGSSAYVDMIGGEFLTHPPHHEFQVFIADREHYLTVRMPDFSIYDEMYHLKNYDPDRVKLLAYTMWQGNQVPMAYVREYGKGRVSYLANGHTLQAWNHPEFRKLVIRAIAWTTGEELPAKTVNCGLLGYGGAFNMGRFHAGLIDQTPGLKTIAVCDINPERIEAAKQELPNLEGYFTNMEDMLEMEDLDLVVVILPHNLHAPAAVKCLESGKHVVIEKPMCLTVREANLMIDKARENHLMLSVFHNRRWDSDFLLIKDIISRGLIGEVFHIEASGESYGHPGFWWRSDKEVSGGIMYDWGAHFIDWILNLAPYKISQIEGVFHKRVWHSVTNEDYGQVVIHFENGVTADYIASQISAIPRPKWRILGTLGAIEVNWNEIHLVSYALGIKQDSTVKPDTGKNLYSEYYRNIADHLLMSEELIVKPEQAKRVIEVIESAELSAKTGKSVPPIGEA